MIHTGNDTQQPQANPIETPASPFGGSIEDMLMRTVSSSQGLADSLKIFNEQAEVLLQDFCAKNSQVSGGLALISDELAIPTLAVYLIKGDTAFTFCLLLEKFLRDNTLESKFVENMGTQIEIDPLVTELFSDTLKDKVASAVSKVVDKDGLKVRTIGFCMVPKTVDFTDERIARSTVESAVLACAENVLELSSPTIGDIQSASVPLTLVNKLEVNPGAGDVNNAGLPISTDFTATLQLTTEAAKKSNDPHKKDVNMQLAKASGFVDIIRTSVGQNPAMNKVAPPYMKHVVLTDMSNMGAEVTREGLSGQLLSLVSIANLVQGDHLLSVYNTASSRKASLANLGYEFDYTALASGGIPAKKDAKPFQLTPQHIGAPVAQGAVTPYTISPNLFREGVVVSLDFQVGSRLHWVQRFFMDAAGLNRDPQAQARANEMIINEIDRFTNGKFKGIWGQNPIMLQGATKRVDGTYVDEDGVTRDIRDIDYLKTLELSKGDAQLMEIYQQASQPTTANDKTCHDYRENLKQLLAGGFEQRGIIFRLTFHPNLINAMLQAIHAAGMTMRTEGFTNLVPQLVASHWNAAPDMANIHAPAGLYVSNNTNWQDNSRTYFY